jgi:hypothetical protein
MLSEDDFAIGDIPLLLLPVRLETRFAGSDLQIRIYPDQIHVDGHSPLLTAAEYDLGVAYWNQRLDGDPDGARDALVAALAPRRAVWVARETRPDVGDRGKRTFPELDTRRATRPPHAALLPERWCAVGYTGNVRAFVAYGSDVTQPLSCAPDVADLLPYDPDGDGLPVDDAMAWMTDYARALDAGMAITVDLGETVIGPGGLKLLVLGVRDSGGTEAALLGLLEAHHYTDGLEVVPQGTPTNNTDEASAGWTAAVDDVPALFARELDDDGLAPGGNRSAAGQLADALGLDDDSLLRRVTGADADEDAVMAAMNRALWPVTWGRYLDDLLAPDAGESIVPAAARFALRGFFIDHVRGGAPLPTLGIGSQPYGVLPLMRRDGGNLHSADPLLALEAVLLELREQWRLAVPDVARLDPVTGGAGDEVAAEVLGSLPHPGRFVVRRLTWQWAARTGVWTGLWDAVGQVGSDLALLGYIRFMSFPSLESIAEELDFLGDLHEDPTFYGIAAEDVRDARTVLDAFSSMCEAHQARQAPFDAWYPDAISGVFEDWVTTDPKIFFSEYGTATDDRLFNLPLVAAGGGGPHAYLSALRDRVPAPPGARAVDTPLTFPGEPPADFSDGEPLLHQLLDPVIETIPPGERNAYAAALDTLAERTPEELELRLRETLGLASHRLDAWLTGLASRELWERRDAGRGGLRIGGFGWVEHLVPDAAATRESEGFVHAPSLAHAATAAVLRAGWSAHGSEDPASLLAVDLRSDRVRTAAYLLDGIRQGGELGDLLGCRFERALHDSELDRFIDPCRRRVLEAAGVTRDPRGPVDGLALAALYDDGGVRIEPTGGTPFTVRAGHTDTAPDRAGLQAALEDILRSMDAVADAAIADSVHHLLQANTSRASASLDAIATAAVPPPELRGLDTPRPGASVSHRVLVTLDPAAGGATGWGAGPRAALEPALERWAAGLLPAPAAIRLDALIAGERIALSFAELVGAQRMSALDAVLETEAAWADRARAAVLARPAYAEREGEIAIDLGPADIDAGSLSAADLAELTTSLRELLARCRPLDARDLALPGAETDGRADLDEAEQRLARFRAGLEAATDTVAALLAADGAELVELRSALSALAPFGLAGAWPVHGYVESARATLLAEAGAVAAAARARVDAASALEAGWTGAPTPEQHARRLRRLLAAVAGKSQPLLPRFDPATSDFAGALDAGAGLLGDDPAQAIDWLRAVARVREDTARLDDVITATELLYDEARMQPAVGQLPVVAGEPWVAIDAADDRRRGKLSLFVVDAGGRERLTAGQPVCGLVVDTWAEVVPAEEVVTGVALDYDAPTSRPPQALLLALPPAGRQWSLDNLLDTLLDGFEAVKLRVVDQDVLATYGHQIPAIFPPGAIAAGPQEALVG